MGSTQKSLPYPTWLCPSMQILQIPCSGKATQNSQPPSIPFLLGAATYLAGQRRQEAQRGLPPRLGYLRPDGMFCTCSQESSTGGGSGVLMVVVLMSPMMLRASLRA